MAVTFANADLLISAGRIDQFPALPLPQAVFSGRSNVGKSSLLNAITGRKALARVSSAPGKTITVNFYKVDNKLMLVDLPGYGFAKRGADARDAFSGVTEGYFTKNKNFDLCKYALQLVDMGVGPTADDLMMMGYMRDNNIPFAVIATKSDKLNKTERTAALEKLANCPLIDAETPVIPFSAKSLEGRDDIRKLLLSKLQVKA